MNKKQPHQKAWLTFSALIFVFWLSVPAGAQSVPAQDNRPVQDGDTTRRELANFDRFLDEHREIAADLRKDPYAATNWEYLKNHPALQDYLRDHPAVSEEIKENPDAFMHAENRYDRTENNRYRDRDTTRGELASFDRFLDGHREISEQLRKDPSLLNNKEFVKNHPALQDYLQDHPNVREEIKENPNDFMHAENRYDRTENNRYRGDRDTTRGEVASFDRFLDGHREVAEQIRKNPSLVNNQEFVKNHPALQAYLQDHPNVREEIKENPKDFMVAENRYDRREDGMNRREDQTTDRDTLHRHFGEFLGGHSDIAQKLSKDPSLVKNQEFLESHSELKAYLNAHPEVRQELMANPQAFVKSAQQFNNNSSVGNSTGVKTPAATANPKPKQ